MPQSHVTASEPRLLTALAGQPPEDLQDVGADVQVCLLDLIEHGAHLRQMPLPFGDPKGKRRCRPRALDYAAPSQSSSRLRKRLGQDE